MTDRDVPFAPNTPCDNCGTMGAFDFMGDYLCMKCGLGEQAVWHIDNTTPYRLSAHCHDGSSWLAEVYRYGEARIDRDTYTIMVSSLDEFIERLQSLRELAREHFGENCGNVPTETDSR